MFIPRGNLLHGDEFVRHIVQEMPRFLAPGGFAQVVCNWIQPGNDDWVNRLSGWYKDSGCDAWVLRKSETQPAKYAQNWLKDFEPKDMEQRQKAWLNYYQQNNIAAIGFSLITLRRDSKALHWNRIDKSIPGMSQNIGHYIEHIFQIQNFLSQTQKKYVLLNQRFRVCPDLRIDRQSASEPGGSWSTVSARLVLTQGILHQIKVDAVIMDIVMFCKPDITLGKLLIKIAGRQKISPAKFISTYLPACRKLIELGFLWPAKEIST